MTEMIGFEYSCCDLKTHEHNKERNVSYKIKQPNETSRDENRITTFKNFTD